VLRAANEMGSDLEVVAVNDIGEARTFTHLLKYDTALGTFRASVDTRDSEIVVDGAGIRFLPIPEPGGQPWAELKADLVIESTGHFTDAATARPTSTGVERAR
jgi:glyceraldehyde 3-phosphate dehydrogenase